jgi:hypothetical protein
MPYVMKHQRGQLDRIVDLMKELDVKANGDLNYVLYAFCKRHVKPSYNNYKNFCGELTECAVEIRRRMLGPYEDIKIHENGDVA